MTGINRRELLRGMLASGVRAALPAGAAGALLPGSADAAPAAAKDATPLAPLGDASLAPRERLLFDFGWRFHPGHASDPARDFEFGTFQRTFAKAGKDTATAAQLAFDDSSWQQVDLPHDWAVTLPFRPEPISATLTEEDPAAAHGYKALGTSFPENSVGWYRRTLQIPASDLGKRISLVFDGVFRDCVVFCNGHIVGRNASGYCGFEVDLSEVLDYGKPNLIAVRVDATLGEGWFYEGAGIYRHLWLQKTDPYTCRSMACLCVAACKATTPPRSFPLKCATTAPRHASAWCRPASPHRMDASWRKRPAQRSRLRPVRCRSSNRPCRSGRPRCGRSTPRSSTPSAPACTAQGLRSMRLSHRSACAASPSMHSAAFY